MRQELYSVSHLYIFFCCYVCIVIFVYMEPKGAQIAIDNLHGKAISKCSNPMVVELSKVSIQREQSGGQFTNMSPEK